MRKIDLVVLSAVVVLALAPVAYAANGMYNVRDYGAVGDGSTDDTTAFQNALNAANNDGGGLVTVPAGQYMIATRLNVPANVALEGVSSVPPAANPTNGGSVLLSVVGAGSTAGEPFIKLNTCSTLRRITVFYPNQTDTNPPVAYPYCIGAAVWADNCSLIDVTLVNPYWGIDFGDHKAVGRHYIDGLWAQALNLGIYINACFDIGRTLNCHFGPIWTTGPAKDYMRWNATAFLFGRTDVEETYNCSAEGYMTGFRFTALPIEVEPGQWENQSGAGRLVNATTRDCFTAIWADNTMTGAGWGVGNSNLDGKVFTSTSMRGQLQFTNCNISVPWGMDRMVQVQYGGTSQWAVGFQDCHFGPMATGYTMEINSYAFLCHNCTFDESATDIWLQGNIKKVNIGCNTMKGGCYILDQSSADDKQMWSNLGATS